MSEAGILTGPAILAAIESGEINISPFDRSSVNNGDRVNPASYDLTLGNEVAVYESVTNGNFDPVPEDYWSKSSTADSSLLGLPREVPGAFMRPKNGCLDAAKPNPVKTFTMQEGKPFLLMPGIGYLMHTVERIHTDHYVPIIDGKSSIGRLFTFVHITAGYGDAGFNGQYTLEVVVIQPTIVYPGMRFCQMRFHTMVGERMSYADRKSNYIGVLAEGPVPSRSWKMFESKQ